MQLFSSVGVLLHLYQPPSEMICKNFDYFCRSIYRSLLRLMDDLIIRWNLQISNWLVFKIFLLGKQRNTALPLMPSNWQNIVVRTRKCAFSEHSLFHNWLHYWLILSSMTKGLSLLFRDVSHACVRPKIWNFEYSDFLRLRRHYTTFPLRVYLPAMASW
jgi:hypothetical protein